MRDTGVALLFATWPKRFASFGQGGRTQLFAGWAFTQVRAKGSAVAWPNDIAQVRLELEGVGMFFGVARGRAEVSRDFHEQRFGLLFAALGDVNRGWRMAGFTLHVTEFFVAA